MTELLAAFAASVIAFLAAVATRRSGVARLGAVGVRRLVAVQLVAINAVLLGVVYALSRSWGWPAWAFALGYGALFFFYTRANIDWVVSKFHAEQG